MHDQGIVHGDLKGVCVCTSSYLLHLLTLPKANIMIDKNKRAVLADFSLITLVPDQKTFLSTCLAGGTAPWMSPELLDPESFKLKKSRPTRESDCYALGMVVYEILSGQAPYSPSCAPLLEILRGVRPERPQGAQGAWFTDEIWGMLELCWKHEPSERISAKTVLPYLQGDPPDLSGGCGRSDTASIISQYVSSVLSRVYL